jgi:YfiH family protein
MCALTLKPITAAPLSGLTHGFFTRTGGVSAPPYDSLNCGPGSQDSAAAIAENRGRVAAAMGVGPDHLVTLHQVHSAICLAIDAAPTGPRARADALVTATPGLAIAVLTADCQPVLFADPDAGVIGAAHAGWTGALAGVLEATLDGMEQLGADRARVTAVIGPCISQRAYEVGPEFVERFLDQHPENARFFASGTGDRALFDLPGYGLGRLLAAGVGSAQWTRHCTFSDPDRFFSWRRTCHQGGTDYGRLIATIRL